VIIAAPVLDSRRGPDASLVLCPAVRPSGAKTRELGALVRDHARKLGQRLGMRLLSGSAGGASHPVVAAIAGLVKERLPELRLVSRDTHGRRNLTALQNGEAAYCTAVVDSLESAYLGFAPDNVRHNRLRLVVGLAPLLLHVVVRADSPVRSFQDLLRVRVSPGERDYATAQAFSILASLAAPTPRVLERAMARTVHLDYVEANREFAAGKLDALISLNSVPHPAYLRIARQIPIRLVPVDEELIAQFIALHRCYALDHIAAGQYPGCEKPTQTLGTSLALVASEERPDEEVYEVARVIHEGRDRLARIAPGFARETAELLPARSSVPLQPGGLRYWRKVGVKP
jgi:TRAP transporter TAXI family solute receptor